MDNRSTYGRLEQLEFNLEKRIAELEQKEEPKRDDVYFKYAIWSITCMASTAACVAGLVLIIMEVSKNVSTTTATT